MDLVVVAVVLMDPLNREDSLYHYDYLLVAVAVDLVLVFRNSTNHLLGLLVLEQQQVLVVMELRMVTKLVVVAVVVAVVVGKVIQRDQSVEEEQMLAFVAELVLQALVLLQPSLKTKPYQHICVLRIEFLSCSWNHLLLGMDHLMLSTFLTKFC